MKGDWPEFCARCGNYYPDDQVCNRCTTDAEKVAAAAAVLRARMDKRGKHPILGMAIVRTLERWAAAETKPGAHYHDADPAPITGGWACYCENPHARERPENWREIRRAMVKHP